MNRRSRIAWLALPALVVALLFAVVLASFARVSLLAVDPGSALFHGPATLRNYDRLLSSPGSWRAVAATLRISTWIAALSLLLGYPLARVLARSGQAWLRRTILFCLISTFLSGGVTRAYAWLILLGNHGWVNTSLHALDLPPVALINNEVGVVIAVLNFVLPFFVLTLFGALRTIPLELEHAARNLGASRLGTFRHVTLPLSLPGISAATSLSFVLSLGAFLFPQLLGGGRVQVLSTAIYDRIQASYDIPSAAALAMLFLALMLLLAAVAAGIRCVLSRRSGIASA